VLSNARESTALDKTGNNKYDSIDARFESIETEIVNARGGSPNTSIDDRLDTIEGNVSDLSTNKISTSAIANNLTTSTAGKVLDAYQGKELENKKINYTDVKDNLTSTDTDRPLSAYQGKVLADRIDLIDNESTGTVHGLDTRVIALEEELDMNSADGERRLDDIETRLSDIDEEGTGALDTIRNDLNTIATELGMMDN
jgi:hypothetical protein